MLTLVSFGFKYGPPPCNHSFDVSFLKNPARYEPWSFWSPHNDTGMYDFMKNQPEFEAFLSHATKTCLFLATIDDDVRIGFGCSSGRHRSPIVVNSLAGRLSPYFIDHDLKILHRELDSRV